MSLENKVKQDVNKVEATKGWTPYAERLNGRVAMLFFAIAVITELFTGLGPVNQVLSLFGIQI